MGPSLILGDVTSLCLSLEVQVLQWLKWLFWGVVFLNLRLMGPFFDTSRHFLSFIFFTMMINQLTSQHISTNKNASFRPVGHFWRIHDKARRNPRPRRNRNSPSRWLQAIRQVPGWRLNQALAFVLLSWLQTIWTKSSDRLATAQRQFIVVTLVRYSAHQVGNISPMHLAAGYFRCIFLPFKKQFP